MLKWLLLIEPFLLHGFLVQTDALKSYSATFLLSNYLACFHSLVLFQVLQPHFLPQKQPQHNWICSSRKWFTDTARTSQHGGEHKEQPWTRTHQLLKIHGLFKEKLLTIWMEEEYFFSFSFVFLPSYFSLLISHKSESIFQSPFLWPI